jgi:hypothetical protein
VRRVFSSLCRSRFCTALSTLLRHTLCAAFIRLVDRGFVRAFNFSFCRATPVVRRADLDLPFVASEGASFCVGCTCGRTCGSPGSGEPVPGPMGYSPEFGQPARTSAHRRFCTGPSRIVSPYVLSVGNTSGNC